MRRFSSQACARQLPQPCKLQRHRRPSLSQQSVYQAPCAPNWHVHSGNRYGNRLLPLWVYLPQRHSRQLKRHGLCLELLRTSCSVGSGPTRVCSKTASMSPQRCSCRSLRNSAVELPVSNCLYNAFAYKISSPYYLSSNIECSSRPQLAVTSDIHPVLSPGWLIP
jgi:hypothetical protein